VRAKGSMKTPLLTGAGPLSRVPPVVVFVLVAAAFVVGVVVRGVPGALILGVLALGIGVLLAATWRVLAPPQRVGRVVILAVLVAVAASVLLVNSSTA
jgi:hypothetical protein